MAQKKGPLKARYFAGANLPELPFFREISQNQGLLQWRGHRFPCKKKLDLLIGKPGLLRARNSTGLPEEGIRRRTAQTLSTITG
jgi:hypothetical protein